MSPEKICYIHICATYVLSASEFRYCCFDIVVSFLHSEWWTLSLSVACEPPVKLTVTSETAEAAIMESPFFVFSLLEECSYLSLYISGYAGQLSALGKQNVMVTLA